MRTIGQIDLRFRARILVPAFGRRAKPTKTAQQTKKQTQATMSTNHIRTQRMMRELTILQNPPQGIQAYPKQHQHQQPPNTSSKNTNEQNNLQEKNNSLEQNNINNMNLFEWEGTIQGAPDTPYENGTFHLQITIPERYPLEPPNLRFITPIYHPNIDDRGRICLDILNMPPKGAWRPSLNLSTVLTMVQCLMSEPNPDDGLMSHISEQYVKARRQFEVTAREFTRKYAMNDLISMSSVSENCDERRNNKEESESSSSSSEDESE